MLGARAILGAALAVALAGLVSLHAEEEPEPAESPGELSFLPLRTDGGAGLASPLVDLADEPKSLPGGLKAAPMPGTEEKKAPEKTRATLGLPPSEEKKKPEVLPPPKKSPVGFAVSLEMLWELTLANQPELREASFKYSEARGRQIQAGKYLNPVFSYEESTIGSSGPKQGDILMMIRQEVLTAGKFRLDKTIAATQSASASLELTQKQFDLLTRIRRGYFDYLTLMQETYVLDVASKALDERVKQAQILMKKAGVISKTEVLSLELLYQEVTLEQIRTHAALKTAWGQLAADIGVPGLPFPTGIIEAPHPAPLFPLEYVEERVRDNSNLRQARIDAEAARWQIMRARAEAVPNFTIGGGYSNPNATGTAAGAAISFEAPIPIWDRKQGRIREAEATYARLSSAVYSQELKLVSQAREAYGRYVTARENLKQLNDTTLPALRSRVDLIKQAYQAKAENVNFNDIFQAEQALYKAQWDQFSLRRDLWRAIADLEGLMEMTIEEELHGPLPRDTTTLPPVKK